MGYRKYIFQCYILHERNSIERQGISEEIVGKAIKQYNIPREKLVILTKCFFPLTDNPLNPRIFPHEANSRDYVNKKGLSRKHIFEAVEASLKRLQTDYIDVLQIHRYDYETPREETMKALHGIPGSLYHANVRSRGNG